MSIVDKLAPMSARPYPGYRDEQKWEKGSALAQGLKLLTSNNISATLYYILDKLCTKIWWLGWVILHLCFLWPQGEFTQAGLCLFWHSVLPREYLQRSSNERTVTRGNGAERFFFCLRRLVAKFQQFHLKQHFRVHMGDASSGNLLSVLVSDLWRGCIKSVIKIDLRHWALKSQNP